MKTAAAEGAPRFVHAEMPAIERSLRRTATELGAAAPPALADPIAYALGAGGKRLRPILCIAAYRAAVAGGRGRDAGAGPAEATGADPMPGSGDHPIHDLACAIELVHTYSLIHDDLPSMDDDDLRRGRAATHIVFGEAPAMVCGAALIPAACAVAGAAARRMALPDQVIGRIVTELCRAAGAAGMVGGQLLDLEAEEQTIGLDQLELIHRLKTGALLAASLRIGGLAAMADETAIGALDRFGAALGLAFQIMDDVLDVTGGSHDLGKTAGRDRDLGKATYPALVGLAAARRTARELVVGGVDALDSAGLAAAELAALGDYVLDRDR